MIESAQEADPDVELLLFDGLDAAVIGVGSVYTKKPVVVYSMRKIINCLIKQGMSMEDALDYYGFNIECLWIGEGTPMIVDDWNS